MKNETKRSDAIFKTKWWLVPICEKITNHKHRKLIGWDESFVERGCKYPNRSDFYYKCKICGLVFFNHNVSKEDLERIKKSAEDKNAE